MRGAHQSNEVFKYYKYSGDSLRKLAYFLLAFCPALNANAVDYRGPLSSFQAVEFSTIFSGRITPGSVTWITPSTAPTTWISTVRPFSGVGSAMKAADFGSGTYESVFLRTSIVNGIEKLDSISIQDVRSDVPTNQVKSLAIVKFDGLAPFLTISMGQQPGGTAPLRLLNSSMTGIAASSIIGRRPVDLVLGTVLIYNNSSGTFISTNDVIKEITVN